jgi:hypothetical protein
MSLSHDRSQEGFFWAAALFQADIVPGERPRGSPFGFPAA